MLYKLDSPTVNRSHHRRRRNPHYRRGQRAAALRAITGARIWFGEPLVARTQAQAAVMTGSNYQYLNAAVTLLRSEDAGLLADVVAGRMSLLRAAAIVKKRARLLRAYREAGAADLAAVGCKVGAAEVFDRVVAPAL